MKKKHIIMTLYLIIVLFVMLANVYFVNANDINDIYNVLKPNSNPLSGVASLVLGVIRWVGVVIMIGAIIIKGIKYVTVSPEGKAEIKKDLIMLTVGALILFTVTTLLDIIFDMVVRAGLNSGV
ncbi:MAG: hypothetical protein IJ690_03275 [Clostridia bacterium]|nr:hypothetical protein [Clostridia bacterium]